MPSLLDRIREHPFFVVLAIIACMALVVAAVFISKMSVRGLTTNSYAPGTVPPLPVPPDGQMHYLYGTITAASADSVTVEGVLPGNTKPSLVVVRVAASSSITIETPKDQKVMEAEMQAYQAFYKKYLASQGTSTPAGSPGANPYPTPPMPFTSAPGTFVGLKVGMTVTITPVSGTKYNATIIEAASISAQKQSAPALSASPTASVVAPSAVIPPSPTAGSKASSAAQAIPLSPTANSPASASSTAH